MCATSLKRREVSSVVPFVSEIGTIDDRVDWV
jgi:hypothetical protein